MDNTSLLKQLVNAAGALVYWVRLEITKARYPNGALAANVVNITAAPTSIYTNNTDSDVLAVLAPRYTIAASPLIAFSYAGPATGGYGAPTSLYEGQLRHIILHPHERLWLHVTGGAGAQVYWHILPLAMIKGFGQQLKEL